ncbi:hypothetical protein T02_5848 [Trichinella nativa]|uniref:Uncharacterized protein n=1 Tax=Trichinella nativa TaxID=6335 RepID=A0A0V1KLX2_9BILA|nr:hypothetical protein T02_5848 [Trichinella nativa]
MEKFPHMSGMPIILGTIQRAVMDTVHLVGQGGGWGGEREKAGIKICDMEYEKVSFYMDLEGTLEMAVLIILLKKGKIVLLITSAILQFLPDLNGTKCGQQNAVGRVHHQININILCSPGNALVPFSVKLATKLALDSMPTVERTPIGQLSKLCSPSSISNTS